MNWQKKCRSDLSHFDSMPFVFLSFFHGYARPCNNLFCTLSINLATRLTKFVTKNCFLQRVFNCVPHGSLSRSWRETYEKLLFFNVLSMYVSICSFYSDPLTVPCRPPNHMAIVRFMTFLYCKFHPNYCFLYLICSFLGFQSTKDC